MAKDPDVSISVRTRCDVEFSRTEVEHALRCHLAHTLVTSANAPKPNSFSDIAVAISCDDEGQLVGATLTYQPETPE